jgi:uracil-DNA glycosylase
MNNSIFISALKQPIDSSWHQFLTERVIDELKGIENQIVDKTITPKLDNILRYLNMNLNRVKVIILGQDPYPQKNIATGRAFEVGNLNNWKSPYKNPSLKNIVRSIYYAYNQKILKYSEIFQSDFEILPPNQLFQSWEEQGVMLLNTSFTCLVNQSNSHKTIWQKFTEQLLLYIAKFQREAVWLLWGRDAIETMRNLDVIKYESHHPMICHPRAKDFLYGDVNPFFETKKWIKWNGIN